VRVLVVDAGSSSLKHALVDARNDAILRRGEERWEPDAGSGRHAEALSVALADAGGDADAVGHRVVHGGERFDAPARVDDATRTAIAPLAALAPLHTRAALEASTPRRPRSPACRRWRAFDTAFHRRLPAEAVTYALPREWRVRKR
jgi:acetate kinase